MREDMVKKYFIKTFGCQMNVYDSSRMANMLEDMGLKKAAVLKKSFPIWEEPTWSNLNEPQRGEIRLSELPAVWFRRKTKRY